MSIFVGYNFKFGIVRAGGPVDCLSVSERLTSISEDLQAPAEHKCRLLFLPKNETDQWWESRSALCDAVEGISESLFASISHTKGISIAVSCPATHCIIGIGIDIEVSGRVISERAETRIQGLVSKSYEPEIMRWVRYEAAFKACYGSRDMTNVDTETFVTSNSEMKTTLLTYEEFVVGIAVARRI